QCCCAHEPSALGCVSCGRSGELARHYLCRIYERSYCPMWASGCRSGVQVVTSGSMGCCRRSKSRWTIVHALHTTLYRGPWQLFLTHSMVVMKWTRPLCGSAAMSQNDVKTRAIKFITIYGILYLH